MPGPHCAACEAYEARVMARKDDEVLPADVRPCEQFQMSDTFKAWAVAEMRKAVMGDVRAAGLDRMALLKRKKAEKAEKAEGPEGP